MAVRNSPVENDERDDGPPLKMPPALRGIEWNAPVPAAEAKSVLLQACGSVLLAVGLLARWWLVAVAGAALFGVGRFVFGRQAERTTESDGVDGPGEAPR